MYILYTDKLAALNANKNTVGYVVPRGYEAYSEFRPYEEISAPVAPSAVLQRGTMSVIYNGNAYKILIELKRKMYEILTGQNYDEVLKQKQPWMDSTTNPVKESEEVLEPIGENEITLLESIFDLYPTDSGYVSSKVYRNGDMVMSLYNDKDYSAIYERFGDGEPNVYIDAETRTIRALDTIYPNTVLNL